MTARPEILVAGGGLAGGAAALALAQAGREVLLLEREAAAKDKVCGEFLSVEACDGDDVGAARVVAVHLVDDAGLGVGAGRAG